MQPAAILRVLVDADTGGASANLKKFDRDLKDVSKNAQKLEKMKIRGEFDSTELNRGLAAYNTKLDDLAQKERARAAIRGAAVAQGLKVDNRAMNAAVRDMEKLHKVETTTSSSTRNLDGNLRRLGGSAGRSSGLLKRLGVSFATRIPVAKFAAVGGAIQAAIPPTVALASALGPLTGLLGALPGLATAAVQGFGTLALGFQGVGGAIKDVFALQKTATKDATSSLQAHRAAAEAVRSAIQNVGDAERSLAADQHDAQRAQEDLSQARRDATRELVDMRLAAQGASLSEKEARLELTQAIADQVAVMDDASSTATDVREADLKVQRARLGLKESTVESKRAQEDYTSAQKKGVKGSDQVVSAQDALRNAQTKVADSQRALVDATRQVRLAQLDQKESAGQAAGGVQKLQQAMAGLPPAARNFVRFIIDLKPKLDALRAAAAQGIFPGLTRGIKSAMQNFGVVRNIIGSTADALGNLAEQAGRRIGGREWGRDLQVQGERNVVTITRLGGATLDLADGFRHIMLAAGPLVSFLTGAAQKFSAIFADWAKGARESGQLDAFFQKTIKTTAITVKAFWDFGRALINIGKIADRVWGQDLLKGIGDVAKRFLDWTESVRGQRSIEQYFVRWRKRWSDIAKAVGEVIGTYNRLRREGKTVAQAFSTVIADVLAKLIPKLAGQGFQMGKALISGLWRGFWASSSQGKAVLLGLGALKIFGGKAVILGGGRAVGRLLGLGVAEGTAEATTKGLVGQAAGQRAVGNIMGNRIGETAAGATAGSMLGRLGGKLLPIARKVGGLGLGLVLANGVLKEFDHQISAKGASALDKLRDAGPGNVKIPGLPAPVKVPGLETFKKIEGLGPLPDQISASQKAAEKLVPQLKAIAESSRNISSAKARDLTEQISQLDGVSSRTRNALLGVVNAAAKPMRKITAEFSRLRSGAVLSVKDLLRETKSNFNLISSTMGTKSKAGQAAIQKNFALAVQNIVDFKRRGVISATRAGELIAQVMKTQTGKGKDALAQNMLLAQDAIGRVMGKSGRITQRGLDKIRLLMVNAMQGLGLSPDTIRMSLNTKESARKGKTFPEQRGGAISHGMVVTGGKPAGDSVHALLERGEVVVNRKAVQKMGGPHEVNKLNKIVPRFQKGGVAGMASAANRVDKAQFPYVWGGGHQSSPAQFGPFDCSGAVSYVLQHGGVQIPTMVSGALAGAGQPGPGKVTVFANADHTFMRIGNRYFGTSGENPGGGAGWFSGGTEGWRGTFAQRHFAVGGGAAEKVPRLTVNAPDSGMKTIVQGALDKTRAGANKKLRGLAATAFGGGDTGDPGPFGAANYKGPLNRDFGKGSNTKIGFNQAAMLAEKAGLPGITYAQIAIGESGLRPGAVSPDGGYGLWQMTPRVQSAATVSKWNRIGSYFNPWKNALMAKVLAGGGTGTSNYFGTGSVTDWNAHYDGPMKGLAKGGMVGYAGDSLGVGTIGPLRQALDRKVEGHPSSGKTSGWGVGQLIKGAAQHIFDFGTNDATGAAIKASINAVDTKTGKKPVHVMTVNGTPAGGQTAELKNKAIKAAAHGDVRLVDWAGKHKGQLDSLGHGAYPERARLIAESVRRATGAEGRAGAPDGKDGKTPKVGKPFKGPLGRVLKKTLSSLRHTKDAKKRGTRLKQFDKRIRKDLGLPTKLQDQMKFVSGAAELFGQRADNAALLNVENEDGTTTLGVLEGKDQGGWLNEQLGALLTWRNMILDATAIIQKRRDEAARLLAGARKRLKKLQEWIPGVIKAQSKRREDLKELRKKPKVNKDKIEHLRELIMRVQGRLDGAKREQTGLETIVPTLKGRVTALGTALTGPDGLSTNLVDLQGIGGPLNKIKGIPTLGQIPGGSIFETQISLRDLATQATATASDSPVTDDTSVELLKQLLREANLRTTVSQRQYDVLKNFDATSGAPFLGAFAKGGVALVGERGPELAHLPSGTRVHSASDTEQMLAPNIAVHINGDIVNTPRGKDPVEVLLNDRRFKAAIGNSRLGGRAPLPGRGGGGS